MSDKSDNLKPFKKGFDERRNMKGAPKGKRVSTTLNDFLNNPSHKTVSAAKFVSLFLDRDGEEPITNRDALAARLLFLAIVKGDMSAIREVIDRTEGSVKQEISTEIGIDKADFREQIMKAFFSETKDNESTTNSETEGGD